MISSTARDLPEHRKEVIDACLRQGMFPTIMEHLPASDDEAISASLALVDEADFYLGIFTHRYGFVPKDHAISVTEMEYNRAVERKIPRLIFVIGKDHPIKFEDVEMGEAATKLQAFKDRVGKENIVNFFNSPTDLRAHVINSLSQLRVPDLTAFHYVSDIPAPPEPFIAHPYTLLQTHRLVGRQTELNLLTDWVAKPESAVYQARILNVVAIGGMGKSALTWKWFNEIAPQEMKPLAGRLWWSFYESDATFENFITRALAYVTRRPLGEVEQIPAPEREAQLLSALDREPFLIVLDGLERMLIAYARMDAAHLSDDDYDRQTANYVANAYGLPASAAQSFTGEHRLRKTADPRAGAFLRKLATVRAARVLVSTRLYPADLQLATGEALGTCFAVFLRGLVEDDALELWRVSGAKGSRDQLLSLFHTFSNHPLLIQSMASEVARFRRAPGDFDAWQQAHPDFNPFRDIPLVQVKSHVLEFALRSLGEPARQTLQTIAAFRMPASYDTLTQLLIGKGKPCANERKLDAVLTELEDRGLVGWDKRANRYDLHPIVRGVVWSGLGDDVRRVVYTNLRAHFEAVPRIDEDEVSRLEDLTPAIELYNTLIGLGRFDDAGRLFYERLNKAMLYRLSASRQRVELLELLFPDGLDQLPRLRDPASQAFTLNALAQGYQFNGQPGSAASLFRLAITICSELKREDDLSVSLVGLSYALRQSGIMYEAEAATRRALVIAQNLEKRFLEAVSLQYLGATLAARGMEPKSRLALQRALRISLAQPDNQLEGAVNYYLAQRALWLGEFTEAYVFANRAWELARILNYKNDFIAAARVQGESALGLHDFAVAEERLHQALTHARQVNLTEEELPALIALAELRRWQGKPDEARALLDDVWDIAERGPYPLLNADACNVLAQLERDVGHTDAAIEAAARGYQLAWCDGPPFAYHRGLEIARQHLHVLGVPEPLGVPFDASKYETLLASELYELDEQIKELESQVEQKTSFATVTNISARSIDSIVTFFRASGYSVNNKNQSDLQVTPKLPFDKDRYGSSMVRYLESLPKIEDLQEFCKESLLVPGSPASGYKLAFLVCPRLELVHQLQAAVYRDKRLAVVPITYDWILESNARGEQRKDLQSILVAFVGRDDPFNYTYPVSVPGDFYGREDVAAALIRDLDHGQSVGLFGMRKIGKTSLIQHTLRTRTGPTIYIDCQGHTQPLTVLRSLPPELHKSLNDLMPRTRWPEFDDKYNNDLESLANAIRRYLRDLYSLYTSQSPPASRITLILDEVDRIVPNASRTANDMKEYESLFGMLRGLGQGVERILVCMVAGFSADITQKDIGLSQSIAGNPVYAFFKVHPLGPMSADEVELMMNGLGSRARLQFTAPGSFRLYQWAGGHPFLSRLMGSVIHRNIDLYKLRHIITEGRETYEVDEPVVDRAANDLLEDVTSRSFVEQILERYNDPLYRAIFKAIAEAGLKGCSRETLMALGCELGGRQAVKDALNSLEVASLIRKEGKLKFRLFARLLDELILEGYV